MFVVAVIVVVAVVVVVIVVAVECIAKKCLNIRQVVTIQCTKKYLFF